MVLRLLLRASAASAGHDEAHVGNVTLGGATVAPSTDPTACIVDEMVMVNYAYEVSFIVAVITIIVLGFCYDRDEDQPRRCSAWPQFLMPLDLLDYGNRWNYVAVFGAMASSIIVIFTGMDVTGYTSTIEQNDIVATYFSTLVSMARTLEIAVSYCPLFACVMARPSVLVYSVGLVFAVFRFSGQLYLTLICPDPIPEVVPYLILIVQLPGLCCLGWLVMGFLYRTLRAIWKGHCQLAARPGLLVYDFQRARVRQLLIPISLQKPPEPPETTSDRIRLKLTDLWHEYIYDGGRHFQYTNRIVCVMAIIWFCTYQIGLVIFTVSRSIDNFSNELASTSNTVVELFALFGIAVDAYEVTNIIVHMFFYERPERVRETPGGTVMNFDTTGSDSWLVPGVIIVLFRLWHTALICRHYRIHTTSLWRGDPSFMPASYTIKRREIILEMLKFAGYQIAYVLWAVVLLQGLGFLFCLAVSLVLILPLTLGYYDILIWASNVLLLPSAVGVVISFMSSVIPKLAHLNIDKAVGDDTNYRTVGFKNMNVFQATDFLFLVLNIATGMFSALGRAMLSFLFALFFMGRLEQCVFFPGFEALDKGYNCYIGLLATEQLILHPVLRVFIDLTYNKRSRKSQYACDPYEAGAYINEVMELEEDSGDPQKALEGEIGDPQKALEGQIGDPQKIVEKGPSPTSRRIRQRWQVLYTLVRNPGLVQYRRQGPHAEESPETSHFAHLLTSVAGALDHVHLHPTHSHSDVIPGDDGSGVRLVVARTSKTPHDTMELEGVYI